MGDISFVCRLQNANVLVASSAGTIYIIGSVSQYTMIRLDTSKFLIVLFSMSGHWENFPNLLTYEISMVVFILLILKSCSVVYLLVWLWIDWEWGECFQVWIYMCLYNMCVYCKLTNHSDTVSFDVRSHYRQQLSNKIQIYVIYIYIYNFNLVWSISHRKSDRFSTQIYLQRHHIPISSFTNARIFWMSRYISNDRYGCRSCFSRSACMLWMCFQSMLTMVVVSFLFSNMSSICICLINIPTFS